MAAPRIVVEDSTGTLLDTSGEVTFGTRTGCSVVLDDAIAAERHCRFAHDGTYVVRDLGSVSGTWLDGSRVDGARELRDGNQVVFGASRVLVKVETRDGTPTLVLQLQRNGFWWRKAGKKVFDNDPDALVRAEVDFGRFPALRVGNRLAMVAGAALLLAGTFVAAVMEPLADPGPLLATHALVTSDTIVPGAHQDFLRCRALADAQGCNVCHTTGAGTPHGKCVQCHADFVAEGTRRHPYVGDGQLGALTGMVVDDAFCVVCHTDHQGKDWLKPASDELVGKCEACHGADSRRDDLEKRVPPKPPPTQQLAYPTWTFPHAAHVEKQIDCVVCHRIDPDVQARKDAGFPDDPARQEFATVPYETCASCHVPKAPAVGMTAVQQETWRAKDHQWTVAWHGTDDGGKHCAACHASGERSGRTVFGPELKTVARPVASAAVHAAERARYTTTSRSHAEQFEQHAMGRQCTTCHLAGNVAPGPNGAPRIFWHALHVDDGALRPAAGQAGAVSSDDKSGCVSCHQDMRRASTLTDARQAAYHWPTTEAAQAACKDCHRQGDRALPLQATATTVPASRTQSVADFPHDVHVGSQAFGRSGTLAEGCFACHEFETPAGGTPFQAVPRTKAAAADCTQCHTGHAHVGGGDCQQCHPSVADRSNSFLLAAAVAPGTLLRGKPTPAEPTRPWPGPNSFSHLSRGHVGKDITCATCHDQKLIGASKTLADVPVPDDATPACRECHLQKQFHWR